MNKVIICLLLAILAASCQQEVKQDNTRIVGETVEGLVKISKEQRVLGRYLHEIEMTADPNTGKVPKNRLEEARKDLRQQLKQSSTKRNAIPGIVWEERGPNNVGGRTRSIMFDPNDATNKKVWAGSVGGGLWFNDDITNAASSWTKVDDFWNNMAVSAIAYDPTDTDIFYVGTGEAYGNADAIGGDGIWKTTDGGVTWAQLANTTSFSNITKIKVLADGTVLAGTRSRLRRSTDEGVSWSTASNTDVASMSIANNGDVYIGGFYGDIIKSTNNGANWINMRDTTGNRVELSCAPSDADIIYAMSYKYNAVDRTKDIHWFQKSINGGSSWDTLVVPGYPACSQGSNHFTRSQGWYDLTMIVHPTDANKLVVGGVDVHASSDGGATWNGISNWTGGCRSYVHADIHAFLQRPGVDNSLLVGCDGGVFYAEDIYPAIGNPVFNDRIKDYNVTQFYHGDIHPQVGLDYILAGAQDNGTQRIDQAGIDDTDEVTGGDGAFTHIDQDQGNIQISAYVYNTFRVTRNGFTAPADIQYVTIGNKLGRFINPTAYDWRQNIVYGVAGSNQYSYVKGIGSSSLSSGTTPLTMLGGGANCLTVSPNITDRLYIGNDTTLLRVDNAQSNNPVESKMSIPVSQYTNMSSIEVERGDENHILVTYSNYSTVSIWETTDGGATWLSVEGDLPNMPVRSIVLNPNDNNQAIIGTELGVWSTDDLHPAVGGVDWEPSNTGLANVRTDLVRYRESDNEMIAVTHGRGVYSTSFFDCGQANGCYPARCRIGDITIGAIDCDAMTDMYTTAIDIALHNTPSTGMLDVNGVLYPFTFDQDETLVSLVLTGPANGASIDLAISFTDSDCDVFRAGAFTAPTPGCGIGTNCATAISITTSGTYNVPNVATGGGCFDCGGNAVNAFWYTFTPQCSGIVNISSCNEGVDTRVHLYAGNDCNGLVNQESNDDQCTMGPGLNAYASEISNRPVIAGTTYYIEWDDQWSQAGFDWSFNLTQPSRLYVDQNAVASAENGCSWADAILDITDALQIINENTDYVEIWVAAGSYTPGAMRYSTFNLSSNIKIYGGFAGNETDLNQRNIAANTSTLSGEIGMATNTDNCYHIMNISEVANDFVIDGFTIEYSYANPVQGVKSGGGILNYGAGIIKNCIIQNCVSENGGSALYNQNIGSTLVLEDVILINNSTLNNGESVLNSMSSIIEVRGLVEVD